MLGGHSADRSLFLSALEADLHRDAGSIAVIRVDFDRFSRIRETFGPAVARIVRSVLMSRLEEIAGPGHSLLRYGEDSFIGIITITSSRPEDLESTAMGIVEAMSAPIEMQDGLQIAVGTNVGIAAAADFDGHDSLRLLTGAELAIQRANAIGSRRAIVYEVDHHQDPTRLPSLFADMLGAIHDGQFQPIFQPVIDVADRRIHGAETLVRWIHPEHGVLRPGEFMAEAEKSGLIRSIDATVRDAACRQCATWPAGLDVAINLSAVDLDAPSLPRDIERILAQTGLAPERLVFEVTETALAQAWSRSRRRLEALKNLGTRLAVDDFGSGHMFLDRLSIGLFDILKIDRSLAAPQESEPDRAGSLLSAVTSMAHTLGMSVVAEGVETEGQFDLVRQAGCDQAQGYLFAQPMAAEDFTRLVATTQSR